MGRIGADDAAERAAARNIITAVSVVLVFSALFVPWRYPAIPYVVAGLATALVILLWTVPFAIARLKPTAL